MLLSFHARSSAVAALIGETHPERFDGFDAAVTQTSFIKR